MPRAICSGRARERSIERIRLPTEKACQTQTLMMDIGCVHSRSRPTELWGLRGGAGTA
ncbi:MAG: hypothetical protein LBF24_03225 [Puniceicoccales bacterium]|nr:hypothetical protein [Puniceicoccales bacterium]